MTDPNDETAVHPTGDPAAPTDDPAAPTASTTSAGPVPPAQPAAEPSLQADPNRPADSGWREPAWFPPRERQRDRRPSTASVVVGLVLIGLGAWFFLDRTLGVTMPRIQWSSVWPIILIVIGGLILVRSFQRKA